MKPKTPANLSMDVYAFGVVMWEIATLQAPYGDVEFPEFYATIMPYACSPGMKHPLLNDERMFSKVPSGYVELMASCLSADPDSRPTMVEVVKRLGEVYQGLSEIGSSCPPKSRESQRFEVLMEELAALHRELESLRRVVNRGFLHAGN